MKYSTVNSQYTPHRVFAIPSEFPISVAEVDNSDGDPKTFVACFDNNAKFLTSNKTPKQKTNDSRSGSGSGKEAVAQDGDGGLGNTEK